MARPRLTDEDIWELLYNCPEDGESEGPSDDDQDDRDYVQPDDSASSSSSGEIPSPRKARRQAYVAASTSRPHQAPTRRQHGPDPDSLVYCVKIKSTDPAHTFSRPRRDITEAEFIRSRLR